ncbi:hypothetical protein NKJ13_30355 [Mesorhizobium sp. M0174]|uniref:hypothetical protein n=1 Tax=Mesorhizobium sp. M0174 TaxID=2956904 RepID=UPI00333DC137
MSSSTKTSLTNKRTILGRSLVSKVSADCRRRWRKEANVSANRMNDMRSAAWHGAAQFVQRQEIFRVGGQEALDAFAGRREVAFDRLLPFLRWLARTGRIKATVKLSGGKLRSLDQQNDLLPHDVI